MGRCLILWHRGGHLFGEACVTKKKEVRLTSATGWLECSRSLKEHCATERNCVTWPISTAYGAVL